MWHKFLSLATFAYNIFHTPNLGKLFPYELVFRRKPRILINIETDPYIKISGMFKDYHTLLTKRLDAAEFQDEMIGSFEQRQSISNITVAYLISPLTSQLRTSSRKFGVNYVGPLVVYKIVDPHNYLLMTIEGQLMRGLFEHERLKPAILKMDKGIVNILSALKRVMNLEIST